LFPKRVEQGFVMGRYTIHKNTQRYQSAPENDPNPQHILARNGAIQNHAQHGYNENENSGRASSPFPANHRTIEPLE